MTSDLPRLRREPKAIGQIDCLSWKAGLSLTAFGVTIGIRVSDSCILSHLSHYLPPGWTYSAAPLVERLYSFVLSADQLRSNGEPVMSLYANGKRLAQTSDLDQALAVFESDLQLFVAEMASRRVFVHAGVVGWHGEAIVLPGRSFSGKTSLVLALVQAGATYFSDEYAVLDAQGYVHPYARPLSVRQEGRKNKYSVAALGGRIGTRPIPVGLVILSEFRCGTPWSPRQLSAGQGALGLLDNTVSARRRPKAAFAALREVVTRASIFASLRGEANVAAVEILHNYQYYRNSTPQSCSIKNNC